jgi:excisionase family DNA binding protein
MDKLLYTAVETAKMLNVSRATIYVLIREGKLKPVHIGRSMRVHIDEIRGFVDSLVADSEVTV